MYLNVKCKCKTIKLKKKKRRKFGDLWLGQEFSDMTPKVKFIKGNIVGKMYFIKIKTFALQRLLL